jgi:ketol-acid reductoisomerase
MIGIGVRERFLSGEGFYCLVGVHQNASGNAEQIMLALTDEIGGLIKPAIEVTFKQEAVLDLFNEQAFGPAFGRVLLTAISVLIDNGIPPEAALVEMYMSEEMAHVYQKMAEVGLVKQALFHSHTSQYGSMTRGVRFLNLDLKERMNKIYHEIESGSFAKEWQNPINRLKFRAIRYFAMRQWIHKIEGQVRKSLGLDEVSPETMDDENALGEILENPEIQAELKDFKDTFEY